MNQTISGSNPKSGGKPMKGRKRRKRAVRICFYFLILLSALLLILMLVNRPVIHIDLSGSSTEKIDYSTDYKDPGAKAYRTGSLFTFLHKDLSVRTHGKVDTKKVGTYKITYQASYGRSHASVVRKVEVVDRKAPVITLYNNPDIKTMEGQPYQEEGYKAEDDYDGDLTSKVTAREKNGKVYYTVKDSSGNAGHAERKVVYAPKESEKPKAVEGPTGAGDEKTIYLTYDDGPGPYTDQVLEILAKYNVKATFFTTSVNSDYRDRIAKEAAAGHTVAIHTYSHDYAKIYANTAAYWADFDRQNAVLKELTGHGSTLFRFPGGSSNLVSKKYTPGIMTTLAEQAEEKGLTYFDWNVSSGDGGNPLPTDTVFNNVITQVTKNTANGHPSVVLQHDTKLYSVNAIGRIIEWGQANGYHFEPLSNWSYNAHHHVQN